MERILQHKIRGKKKKYLVRWKGYGQADDTWKLEANLKHARSKICDYNKLGYKALRALENFDEATVQLLKRDTTLQVTLVGGKLPIRHFKESAGIVLHSSQNSTITPNMRVSIATGIKITLPHGTIGQIASLNELTSKGVEAVATIIDQSFKEEIRVILVNKSDFDLEIQVGDEIAQLIIERIANV